MPQPIDSVQFLDVVRKPLAAGDADALVRAVRVRWSCHQVCPLLRHPQADVRRVTAIVLGLIGDRSTIACLTRALQDEDEQVNQMAEHGLWSIWFRSGKPCAVEPFRQGMALLANEDYACAADRFHQAVQCDPHFAEAFNQCAIAHFFLKQWTQAISDCEAAIALIPTHFGAISGMGHCYTQMGRMNEALLCYRRALGINPRMSAVAAAIARLGSRQCNPSLDSSGIFGSLTAGR
jgi:tetratricopeptide (TPR) repeat protein